MKILQVSKLYPPFYGGIETVVYDLVQELNKESECIDVLCVSNTNTSSIEKNDNNIIFRCASFAHLFSTYLSVAFLIKWFQIRNNYDIVHIHMPNPLAALAFFIFPTKAKIIIHWHSDIIKQKKLKLLLSPIHDFVLRKSSSIIATSKNYFLASKDLAKYSSKVKVIPIGISDVNREDLISFGRSPKQSNQKTIFSIGRHVYYKGFEYLIRSALHLPDDYRILIGGQGVLTNSLVELTNSLNLQDKITFLGRLSDQELKNCYINADVFCLPSIERSEAYGVVQLEAMSFGIPIVSTEIPGSGVSWVNQHNLTGLVVPPRDEVSLANAIQFICENRDTLFPANIICDHFNANFSREKMASSIFELYKSLL